MIPLKRIITLKDLKLLTTAALFICSRMSPVAILALEVGGELVHVRRESNRIKQGEDHTAPTRRSSIYITWCLASVSGCQTLEYRRYKTPTTIKPSIKHLETTASTAPPVGTVVPAPAFAAHRQVPHHQTSCLTGSYEFTEEDAWFWEDYACKTGR